MNGTFACFFECSLLHLHQINLDYARFFCTMHGRLEVINIETCYHILAACQLFKNFNEICQCERDHSGLKFYDFLISVNKMTLYCLLFRMEICTE